MKKLFTERDFYDAKSSTKLPCECYTCGTIFYTEKKWINQALLGKEKRQIMYCSKKCNAIAQIKTINCICGNCGKDFEKLPSQIKKSKNNFCSRSCAITYNNKHKTTGTRRSKLEIWLEGQLTNIYPNLEIHFNRKDTIGSELDIYVPSLNLAFELNGIFHYEPIYGEDKLKQIQDNDDNKFQLCHKHKISLCIIDTSQQEYFKEKSSKKYLDIITNIINEIYIVRSGNFEIPSF